MRQTTMSLVLVAVIFIGGWALFNRDKIEDFDDAINLAKSQLDEVASTALSSTNATPVGSQRIITPNGQTIKIASFNVSYFANSQKQDAASIHYLAKIVSEFDVVAIQQIRTSDQTVLRKFVDEINSMGFEYDFVVSPNVGGGELERYAFVFNLQAVSLDIAHRYTVADPDGLFVRDPFVGWFRARKVDPKLAFTFSLVNIHLDSQHPLRELNYLTDVFRAVRNDGRMEDDVIIAGDFQADDALFESSVVPFSRVVIAKPTNTQSSHQFDNILFDSVASEEFTGRGDVFDFLRHFNLSIDDALLISDHLPVWAEFSVFEGGSSPNRFAENQSPQKLN